MNTNDERLKSYEEYLYRFANMHNITVEEAAEKAIVKAIRKQYLEGDI